MIKNGIPVLMYHGVVDSVNDAINPIHISRKAFEEQMTWLFENNYRAITISDMLNLFEKKQTSPNSVVLTFDDGYQSMLYNATPILKKFNFSATLFLITGAVGEKNYAELNTAQSSFPEDDGPLDWNQLKSMQASCWDIQAHSQNHYIHNMISYESMEKEMKCSKKTIENNLNKKVQFYCYPCGSYNTDCLKLLKTLGYKAAFSVHPGLAKMNSDYRRLPRIEINRYTDLDSFKKKIRTGYNGNLNKLKSSVKYLAFKNTRVKDLAKSIYDLRNK
jgi:peptidoglycan/xylan/chitin deacetylase (PgdA/CDA1 family)